MTVTADDGAHRLVVVVGMHRSGTSVATRALQVLGVELGENLMRPRGTNPFNARGFFEDLEIHDLSTQALRLLGSDWHHLAPVRESDVLALRAAGLHDRAAELLTRKCAGAPVFGFKNPRTSKLLPFWKQVLGDLTLRVDYVIAVRNPLSVAESLARRNGFDHEKSHLMWAEHVLASLVHTRGTNRVLVEFDRLMGRPDLEVTRLARALGLPVDPGRLADFRRDFLAESLRHSVFAPEQVQDDAGIPAMTREIYGAALEAAADELSLDDDRLARRIDAWQHEHTRQGPALVLADKLTDRNAATTGTAADVVRRLAALLRSGDARGPASSPAARLDEAEQALRWLTARAADQARAVESLTALLGEESEAVTRLRTLLPEHQPGER